MMNLATYEKFLKLATSTLLKVAIWEYIYIGSPNGKYNFIDSVTYIRKIKK